MALADPALVTIAHCGTTAANEYVRKLRDALAGELLAMGAMAQATPPCGLGSLGSATGCHAEREPDCQKLLVMVGDGVQPLADDPAFAPWKPPANAHATLPVLPIAAETRFSALFPGWVAPYNGVFWSTTPAEGVAAVLAVAGITIELPKIFISYRQAESAGLAIQIFDALGHAGFDAFLDHFRIPPGVNFQARLTEQLGDKSMVLFLESDTFLKSPWVTYEVNVAKTCGLGLHALNLCGAPQIPGVDSALRSYVEPADFEGGTFSPTAQLNKAKLLEVVALARREHDRSIIRRQQILKAALEGAVLRAGGALPVPIGSRALQVDSQGGGRSYVVALTPRPPDLPDFYRVHGQAAPSSVGVVVGLSRLMEQASHQRLVWLAGVSKLEVRDEGDMLTLGREMVQGLL
ncbi:toll/interleukin-1 receptor domain-containing protein [Xanthobacter versatilis]|uniref:toll/interleukin-1 receptor domain-containing protein n=1 Tax=Xanthobacter autotrophicus (strain ATCC BAA-1158 / Py2) TaxID=78245 RepID=UPI00372A40A6